jgi:16S rRNA G966 N2-methylase RsmD
MNMLAARIPGCRWLDLCCGSGVMACEALRRGAAEVVAVERDRRVARVARDNLELVVRDLVPPDHDPGGPSPRVRVIRDDVIRWLTREGPADVRADGEGREGCAAFDLIYVDPPYLSGLHQPIAERILGSGWLRPGGTMLWECSREAMPEPPTGWALRDQRLYGGTGLMLLEPAPQPPRALPRRY